MKKVSLRVFVSLCLAWTGDLEEILPRTDQSGPIDVLVAPNEILVTHRAGPQLIGLTGIVIELNEVSNGGVGIRP